MSASSPEPPSRPRVVNVAIWAWVAAAMLTTALGLRQLTADIPLFFRMIGAVLLVVGLVQGFLTGRARNGDPRFARAATALAMATVVLDAIILFAFGAGLFALIALAVIMALLITGTFSITRPEAHAWLNRDAAA
jgi:hypothetical protein